MEFRGSGTCAGSGAQVNQAISRSSSEARDSVVRERHTARERREDARDGRPTARKSLASESLLPQPVHLPDQSRKGAAWVQRLLPNCPTMATLEHFLGEIGAGSLSSVIEWPLKDAAADQQSHGPADQIYQRIQQEVQLNDVSLSFPVRRRRGVSSRLTSTRSFAFRTRRSLCSRIDGTTFLSNCNLATSSSASSKRKRTNSHRSRTRWTGR